MDDHAKPALLERFGVHFLRRRSTASGAPRASERPNVLTPEQQSRLRRIERWAIARGCAAGAVFGSVAGAGEIVARAQGYASDAVGGGNPVRFWSIVAAFGVASALLEVTYLYWDGLRSVHALAEIAGVELFDAETSERRGVASALARAALELPNPRRRAFGIDPMKEASKLRIVLGTIAYKAKIGVTSFLIKAFLRRMLARALVRAWLPFVAVPVVALWNCVIVWRVMREARIRAMGPSAARELVEAALANAPELSAPARVAAVRAVGSVIVRQRDLHPNMIEVLREIVDRLGAPKEETLDDARLFVAELPRLSPAEQRVVLDVLDVAVALDGSLSRAELHLLADAQSACGVAIDPSRAKRLAHAFVAGEPLRASS